MFKSYDPKELKTSELHEFLLGTIAPRPIAWASTVDAKGVVNLAPFSFFNVFGSNPPILIFCPSRRVRDSSTKHSLHNVIETKECVINIVDYHTVGQMVLTSAEFTEEINEFDKANLHMEPSVVVKAPRVKESPAQFECKVLEVKELGNGPGAGNLIICEVVYVHLSDHVFGEDGRIDPRKVDNVARMGRAWYTRAAEGLFELPAPRGSKMLGFDHLPPSVKNSRYFTPNELSRLASSEYRPDEEELEMVRESSGMKELKEKYGEHPEEFHSKVHTLTKTLIAEGKLEEAWKILLAFEK